MKDENTKKNPLSPAEIRSRLREARGRDYWRSLEELADTDAFQELLHREFPGQAGLWVDDVNRRDFLKLMAASLALAGLGGCGGPAPTDEKIVPYVQQPEEIIPGKPLFFATAFPLGGAATGVLVESHEGRPTKIEGNADHPASLGATDALAQASILTLYDPDRSQAVTRAGQISTWNTFFSAINAELEAERLSRGAGLRILTESVASPTLAHQLRAFLAKFPRAKWHQYEPVNRDQALAGARLAFGEAVGAHYRLDQADIIVSLDADFLFTGPGSVRYARDFASRRKIRSNQTEMNRLYAVESAPGVTGAMADHRLAERASEIKTIALALAQALGLKVGSVVRPTLSPSQSQWISALARDLSKHRRRSVIVAGESQPALVHALAHAMNHALDNTGRTVIYTRTVEADPVSQIDSLRDLVEDMEAGKVELLVILGGNPVFTAPADLRFGERMAGVKFRVRLGLYEDETSTLCHWHIPEAHYLEAWSDARAYDGTVTILQPLIEPLYRGKSAHDLLAVFLGQPGRSGYEIVREYWKSEKRSPDFERFWRKSLHDGVVEGSAFSPKAVKLRSVSGFEPRVASSRSPMPKTRDSEPENQNSLEIIFRPDPTLFDGRFANNGWLQELPKPLSKITWDNAAFVGPRTAERLGLSYRVGATGGEHGKVVTDLVELHYRGRMARAPAWILPGHPEGAVTVHFGYGRTRSGRVGTGTGFDAYAIRTSDALWHSPGLEIRKTGEQFPLACTQFHHNMEGRRLVRAGTIEEYKKDPHFVHEAEHHSNDDSTLYPAHAYDGYAWGMTIDTGACIGCNACVVACQAENNIPVVGKTEVSRGREMHWLRIDRYYHGEVDDPETFHQPVPCMHCENAPCELVCPVAATVHSDEGLNDMIYNRCVGTRYCSNNCPYKVRRFNFLQYSDFDTPSLKLSRNPNVTVRSRGVMEKCTYCVQRINAKKIDAEKEGREVRDGEIVTACQAACPTQAIVFGNVNDPKSEVSNLKAESLNYGLLTELNTKPRTTYLAKLKNPNPEIETE